VQKLTGKEKQRVEKEKPMSDDEPEPAPPLPTLRQFASTFSPQLLPALAQHVPVLEKGQVINWVEGRGSGPDED